jgi:D-arabinose 1-dehydrogenase-like Zn-dependent alcohol dehydrogenase
MESLRSLKKGGTIVTCGATTGPDVRLDLRHLFLKHQQIIGSTMGNRQDLREVCKLIETKKIKPVISQVFPYQAIRAAHTAMEEGARPGKIVLTF